MSRSRLPAFALSTAMLGSGACITPPAAQQAKSDPPATHEQDAPRASAQLPPHPRWFTDPGGDAGHYWPVRTVREFRVDVQGRLRPDLIQPVVRKQFGAFRRCYESGLRKNPDMAGLVAVKFVITPTGGVASPVDDGSNLPDPDVVQCIVGVFGTLSFSPPEAGTVTVVYRVMFNPGYWAER